jgi:predicted porin
MYDSPNWGGFDIRAAWSSNPTGTEADLSPNGTTNGLTTRKGNAWNFNPKYNGGNWGARYSHWDQKSDGGSNPTAVSSFTPCVPASVTAGTNIALLGGCASVVNNPADQRGDTLLGWMTFGGLKVALGWNKSRLTGTDITNGGAGVETANRTAWTLPISYVTGPHNIYFHYTKANDDKDTAASDGAKMWALAYVYDLSKRTSLGLSYAKIINDAGGAYNFFTNGGGNSLGQFGSVGGGSLAGEKPQLISAILRHAF